jgi:peptidoglycan hydrolase-like protein with peptidoglycan-binding domain
MSYTRALKYTFPLISGEDVIQLQQRLLDIGLNIIGQPDGIFGPQSDAAVRSFQQSHSMKIDGIVGPLTWTTLFEETTRDTALEKINKIQSDLTEPHQFRDSVVWQLSAQGILVDKKQPLETTGGDPKTVRSVWQRFSEPVEQWSQKFGVPAELIIATICTETSGDPSALRKEPGYISDEQTPNKISPGIMQTLISTAQKTLGDQTINREWLLKAENSIRAGTAYIASQWRTTNFDPPKVACAYNAGDIYYNDSATNRWKMRQYPIGSAEHADRFVKWFNDCFVLFAKDGLSPQVSFYRMLKAA